MFVFGKNQNSVKRDENEGKMVKINSEYATSNVLLAIHVEWSIFFCKPSPLKKSVSYSTHVSTCLNSLIHSLSLDRLSILAGKQFKSNIIYAYIVVSICVWSALRKCLGLVIIELRSFCIHA